MPTSGSSSVTVIGSVSGQFFVSARSVPSPYSLDLASGSGMMTLEPALLAISCERIKREVLHQLNMSDQWRGKIFVVLRAARTADALNGVHEQSQNPDR